MADVPVTFASISTDAPNVWIAQEMFNLLEKNLPLGRFAKKHQIEQRNGKTIRVLRWKRLNLPTTPLTEGVVPDSVALVNENVDVTVDQWGIVVLMTDVALVTTRHPVLNAAIDRTSLAMNEMLEREMGVTLLSGTQVFFPGTVTTRAGLLATSVLDTPTIAKASTQLRSKGAPAFEGDLYGGVLPPQAESDVWANDTTFRSVEQFANVRKFEVGEIGVYGAVRWVRGNFLPTFKGVAAPSAAAATAEKAQLTGAVGGSWTANASVLVRIVGRDATNDFERKISQEANFALGAGNTRLTVTLPTSTNYVYDIYVSDALAGGGTARLKLTRQVTGVAINIDTAAATTAATPPAAPADQREVFPAFIFGRDGFGRVELNGMSLKSYITPPGPSWSNPLDQGRKVGSKVMWKSFIIDNDFIARIEVASNFASTLPA